MSVCAHKSFPRTVENRPRPRPRRRRSRRRCHRPCIYTGPIERRAFNTRFLRARNP